MFAKHVRERENRADNERGADKVVEQKSPVRQTNYAGHHVHRRTNTDQEPGDQHDLQRMGFDGLLELLFVLRGK